MTLKDYCIPCHIPPPAKQSSGSNSNGLDYNPEVSSYSEEKNISLMNNKISMPSYYRNFEDSSVPVHFNLPELLL